MTKKEKFIKEIMMLGVELSDTSTNAQTVDSIVDDAVEAYDKHIKSLTIADLAKYHKGI